MPLLRPMRFEGTYFHPRTSARYAYVVSCQIAVDGHGREAMQVRGQLVRDGRISGFLVTGQPDRGETFIGRERTMAEDCVAVACERDAAERRWSDADSSTADTTDTAGRDTEAAQHLLA